MDDIGITFTTIDVIIFITDFIPKIIEKGLDLWDIWAIYLIGTFINYADFYYVTEIGIDPGEPYMIAMASISLVTVAIEIFLVRPIAKILKFWDFIVGMIGNVSLIIALGTEFEDEIFKMLGIKGLLQEYLKDYNNCASQQQRIF